MKVKITFTYIKDVEPECPSEIYSHYEFIAKILQEIERTGNEPRWSIESVDEPEDNKN